MRVIQRSPFSARMIMGEKPYVYYEGIPFVDQLKCTSEILCGLRKREIREFLRFLAGELYEWRNNPGLNERAQRLKEYLLLLEQIDNVLFNAPPNNINTPCCFTELVELLAFDQFVHSI